MRGLHTIEICAWIAGSLDLPGFSPSAAAAQLPTEEPSQPFHSPAVICEGSTRSLVWGLWCRILWEAMGYFFFPPQKSSSFNAVLNLSSLPILTNAPKLHKSNKSIKENSLICYLETAWAKNVTIHVHNLNSSSQLKPNIWIFFLVYIFQSTSSAANGRPTS